MSGRPIRAMFIVPNLWVGGAERHLVTLLPRLDPTRIVPSVVCIGPAGPLFAALPAAGIDSTALELGKRQAGRALCELVSIIRRQRPDVVLVRGYNAETLGRIAARVVGVERTVMWVHNNTDIEPRGWMRRRIDRALIQRTTAYFGVANAQRRYLVDELGYPDDKIRIIHNGVDPELFDAGTDRTVRAELAIADSDPVVGIIGTLRPVKDHATLLRAARTVVDEMPRARFLVVGDGPVRPELESLCAELRITANVHFAGWRGDIAQLLRAMDVFTLTSTSECFPMAVLEAMACARPVVCTDVGGIPEMVNHGESGYLVPPKDPQQLAARLLSLLSDPGVSGRMGRAGRARVEAEFNLDRSVEEAQRAIEDVVMGQAMPVGRVD